MRALSPETIAPPYATQPFLLSTTNKLRVLRRVVRNFVWERLSANDEVGGLDWEEGLGGDVAAERAVTMQERHSLTCSGVKRPPPSAPPLA